MFFVLIEFFFVESFRVFVFVDEIRERVSNRVCYWFVDEFIYDSVFSMFDFNCCCYEFGVECGCVMS